MKRFWTTAAATPEDGHFVLQLDNKPLKLPGRAVLRVPYGALAEAIAAEWQAAPAEFKPDDLPLTQLASTAQERVALHRAEIIRQLAAYGMNDLLCYRAGTPEPLVAEQRRLWDPWLHWARERFAVDLLTTTGVLPIDQHPDTAARFTAALEAYTDYGIAALGVIVPGLGSLVLGLALAEGALDAEAACAAACTDELWQETRWGQDREALTRRRHVLADVTASRRFLELCQG